MKGEFEMLEKFALLIVKCFDAQLFYDARASEVAIVSLVGRKAIRAARWLGYNGGWLTRYQVARPGPGGDGYIHKSEL
jgi:hypothetical protein